MAFKSEEIKAIYLIDLIGAKVSEENLVKQELLTAKIIAKLLEQDFIYKTKFKNSNYLYLSAKGNIVTKQMRESIDNITNIINYIC